MRFWRRRPHRRAVALGLTLSLGLIWQPIEAISSQHTIYDRLTDGDINLSHSVLQDVLETMRSQELRLWRNDATGATGSVMPLRTFKIKTGHYCRVYRETVIADGKMESRDATACRTNDGQWIPVKNDKSP